MELSVYWRRVAYGVMGPPIVLSAFASHAFWLLISEVSEKNDKDICFKTSDYVLVRNGLRAWENSEQNKLLGKRSSKRNHHKSFTTNVPARVQRAIYGVH